jgi:hypothetical protein
MKPTALQASAMPMTETTNRDLKSAFYRTFV